MSDSPTASSHTSETSDEFASTTVVDSEDGNDNGDGNGDGNGDEVEDGSRVILSPDEVCEAWDNAGIDESTHEVCVDVLLYEHCVKNSSIKSIVHSFFFPDTTSLTPRFCTEPVVYSYSNS